MNFLELFYYISFSILKELSSKHSRGGETHKHLRSGTNGCCLVVIKQSQYYFRHTLLLQIQTNGNPSYHQLESCFVAFFLYKVNQFIGTSPQMYWCQIIHYTITTLQ
jgi:hypothetical protein